MGETQGRNMYSPLESSSFTLLATTALLLSLPQLQILNTGILLQTRKRHTVVECYNPLVPVHFPSTWNSFLQIETHLKFTEQLPCADLTCRIIIIQLHKPIWNCTKYKNRPGKNRVRNSRPSTRIHNLNSPGRILQESMDSCHITLYDRLKYLGESI